MANLKLISVHKEGQASQLVNLDTDSKLSKVRTTLEQKSLMSENDLFLRGASQLGKSDESSIPLSSILTGDNNDTLDIGRAKSDNPIGVDDGVQDYQDLDNAQLSALYSHINIFRGLTFQSTGFQRTFKKVYGWKNDAFPPALKPRISSRVDFKTAYSKITHTMNTSSSDEASVSLDTPYGGGSAEYKYAKTHSTSSSEVTEYITGRFTINKVKIQVDPDNLVVDSAFEKAVSDAIKSSPHDAFNQYYALLEVLNNWGYYIPLEFTLGGALLSSDHTTISDYSESDTNKQEYGGSFKAAFDGIGGGASYKHAEGSETTTTTSNKFQITSFEQIGGRDGTTNKYDTWASSLDKVKYWDIASFDKLYPTIGLLSSAPLQNTCLSLMNKYATYPHAVDVQPYLNMTNYATSVEDLYSSPWGG